MPAFYLVAAKPCHDPQRWAKPTVTVKAFGLVLLVTLIVILGLVFVAFLFQRRLLYYPTHLDKEGVPHGPFNPWRDESGNFHGYVREGSNPTQLVLYFHGNAGEAGGRVYMDTLLPDPTLVLVIVEYPGYGARKGTPTEANLIEATKATYQQAKKRWPDLPITLLGQSLGSGVACRLAAEVSFDRLALISPFSSLEDAAKVHYPYLPVSLLLLDRYANQKHLQRVQMPLLLIHGTEDEVVPHRLGEALFAAYPGENKTFVSLKGIGHNNIVEHLTVGAEGETLRKFISGK